MLNEPGRSEVTAANLAAKWQCGHTFDAFKVYRKNLLKLILSESTDPTAFDYFTMFSKITLAVEKRYSSEWTAGQRRNWAFE